ncbi:leucine-rich repeat protein kinase family protein [Tanacetum coccineum]
MTHQKPSLETSDDDDSNNSTITTETIPDDNEEEEEVTSPELDICNKTLDLQILEEPTKRSDFEGLFLYKNVFNLIPRSVFGFKKLRSVKYFGNEVNLFPLGFGEELVNLEKLQVKISLPALKLDKLKGLKELELSRAPIRVSAFPLLKDIVMLEKLTKLSVCYFSIRYLPPEIGCLTYLEYLDLSHNKMKNLPTEIGNLSALITLKVANNKLIEVPSALSSLQRLENLDLSNNRLTSLVSLDFDKMHNLRTLNLQHNKLQSFFQVPVWITCDLEGNDEDMANGESFSSFVEMDVLESTVTDLHDDSFNGSVASSSIHSTASSSNRSSKKRFKKGREKPNNLQEKARQERLNMSRNRKGEDSLNFSNQAANGICESSDDIVPPEPLLEDSSVDVDNKESSADSDVSEQDDADSSVCVALESAEGKDVDDNCKENSSASDSIPKASRAHDTSFIKKRTGKRTRKGSHDESRYKKAKVDNRDLDVSSRYSTTSFCSVGDYLPDGFYDAGRDRPFLPLDSYEKRLHFGSREVILLDRERDEELEAVTKCAKALVSLYNVGNYSLDEFQIAFLLAQFVSDHFGGCDKSLMVDRARKSVSGSNYKKPFVCTCPTGNNKDIMKSATQSISSAEDTVLLNMCEKSLQLVKARRNSIIVPIGTLQFGVCRHRALLMKYLCDRVEPRVPCELVRGYLDFAPHAWNVVVVKRGDSEVRFVVDACRPHDIREEADPEYFYRYIPLSRMNSGTNPDVDYSFPPLPDCKEIKEGCPTTLIQCKLGSVEAAAKVRTLEVNGSSADEIRIFEFNCLGEVRLLSVLKHPCIVNILGHQISTKWLPSQDGTPGHRILQSAIYMEHVKGGSLKHYIEKLGKSGEKHVPMELALQIARDVAWALSELHSKDIIHRDLKSENVLIDLGEESDGATVVKLCDFDRAVPLRSPLHTCCIGHIGIPPPDVCVGTPRWMAPEVYGTIHDRRLYGLEVDLWSFGCLLLELLTLQLPYAGLQDSKIHQLIMMGKRPLLTDELEALGPVEDIEETESETEDYKEEKTLRFLIDIYRQCTKEDPSDRPTAEELYQTLVDFSDLTSSKL